MSTLQFNTWKDTTGTYTYTPCTVWCLFDGTGTAAIIAGENVSSITDNGVGDWTINFTTALASTNYVVSTYISGTGSDLILQANTNAVETTTSCRVDFTTWNGASGASAVAKDHDRVHVTINGGV